MNSERDQRPGGRARNSDSVHDPPATAAPPSGPAPAGPAPESAPQPPAEAAASGPVTDVTAERDVPPRPGPQGDISPEQVREHLRRRAIFLRELAEARELRRRVTPHRSRRARIHAALRRRTFRLN